MALPVYWWSPLRAPRVLARETLLAGRSWLEASRLGGLPFQNFGDELSPALVESATSRKVRWSRPSAATLFGVGSILEIGLKASDRALFWGSGLRSPRVPNGADIHADRFLAVRGALTRDALGLSADTPVGDPALLLRETIRAPTAEVGPLVIPHFAALGSAKAREGLRRARLEGFKVVSPTSSSDEIRKAIGSATFVFSSSLHGKIVADAAGVPATLVSFGPRTEPDFKYHDYMSVWSRRATFVDFWSVLGRIPSEVDDVAREDMVAVSARIGEVTERLIAAAQPLASIQFRFP